MIMKPNTKICRVCGKSFNCPASDKTVTCSKECSKIHRSKIHIGKSNVWSEEKKKCLSEKGQTKNLLKGTNAASESPNSGHFETNINAIDWHIVSPEGKEYRFRNLNLWAEKNYELFGFDNIKEAPKVSAGIQSAKRGAE